MSTSGQNLEEMAAALNSRALGCARPIKNLKIHVNYAGGCVTVQWKGRFPQFEAQHGLFHIFGGSSNSRKRRRNTDHEKICEAKFFYREEDKEPEAWPDASLADDLHWPKDFPMQYVAIARVLTKDGSTPWKMIYPNKVSKKSFSDPSKSAEDFIRRIAPLGAAGNKSGGSGLAPIAIAATAVAVIGAALWFGAGFIFGGDDDTYVFDDSDDSYGHFGSFEDEGTDYSYSGGGPRATYGSRVSGSTSAEEGYNSGGSGDEGSNGIASEGMESVGTTNGTALAGAAAGPVGGRVAFSDLPFCWTDSTGAPQAALSVYREPGGIRLEPDYPMGRSGQFASLPIDGLIFSHPISAAEFEKVYEPLFLYSLDKGCRLAVQEMGSSSSDLSLESFRPALAGYFYIIPRN